MKPLLPKSSPLDHAKFLVELEFPPGKEEEATRALRQALQMLVDEEGPVHLFYFRKAP